MTLSPDSGAPGFWHRLDRLLAILRLRRQPLTLLIDCAVICLAWNVTYLFRLGFERSWAARPDYDHWVMMGVAALYLLALIGAKVPRAMWRFSGFGELKRLVFACTVAGLLSAVSILMLQLAQIPRTVLVLHPLISLLGLCMARLGYRMLYEHARSRITGSDSDVRRAVVLGAGEAARLLLAGLHQQGWTVLGLLDDDPAKRDARIFGVPVLGSLDDLGRLDVLREATHVIVAMPGATSAQRRRAIELGASSSLPVLTVPSFSELRDGTVRIERVRAIEPEDLLGRDPVRLDEGGIADLISGKVVLVTGAGGSIGSELCRQAARYGPAALVLYELSEFALYQIEQSLSEAHPHLPLVRLMGDVKNLDHLRAVFAAHRPQLVLHAAAFKHVPLMEDDNAWAALQNNIIGTWNAATAAAEVGSERFVLISTDKAVNPTNVMGASKRAAEMVLSRMATQIPVTRFVAVRFGNVLGSSGSVIPKFKEQIARGGPVTVTHPDINRYFMTIPEATRLVLQAAALAESGQVYVLDMGDPVKIVDLARDMIRLSGHRESEIGIVYSGLRSGEKLYEELLADADQTLPSRHPRLRIAKLLSQADGAWIEALLEWLTTPGHDRNVKEVREHLRKFVADYHPQ
ncbi:MULTISPECIES: nucleoside-diphosphate sugar epimerase/dehydratase [unclassified Rhizobacter]|uniref:polysaccharide biosynthesis protein n=1 Tax=unclassified Rhizobacter TaxID=2640088 RepID=UPI0006FAA616|nr:MULTISPECIES: nucleoside-diphosphate sugar epimerase/dehydratase [unclassified Rhizobacter]KQU74854.1 polysaccharide biosynthesis protein [Rhizobacter sp. Root29]KQW01071.1 polysaccharide biosynthesis protein [Rhizobacter sp. Root1238]KRB03921.1 polysaccharide biosynthesis protein [Rhizobacter sp. Root16D2]